MAARCITSSAAKIHTVNQQIQIVEVGPRDGLQSEAQVLPTATKVEFIRRLRAAGLRRIEVASFVSPTRVPQMADAEALLVALAPQAADGFIGLVLNRRGFDRAQAAGCGEVGMVVAVSESFSQRNQGCSVDEGVASWLEISQAARQAGMRAQITISTAFGCPFEGEVPLEKVVRLAERIAAGQPGEIAVADTVGVAVPTQVRALLTELQRALPGIALRAHFHNTRNTGLANAYAAMTAGARVLDASLGGIGGCPFAPAATGNIPTEDLVYMLGRMGVATGIDLARAIEAARWVEPHIGHAVPGLLTKAGDFPGARRAAG
ncbi:MAG TPA: hydroxymethylglutaryl-CoA lyase [Steroidobacteraceae bacterium]|nr:hydroxymethylglutaryl-CoA lyase [Steroidobacteraceae bacterium]